MEELFIVTELVSKLKIIQLFCGCNPWYEDFSYVTCTSLGVFSEGSLFKDRITKCQTGL